MRYAQQDFLDKTQDLSERLLEFALSHDAITDAKVVINGCSEVKKTSDANALTASSSGVTHEVKVILFSGLKCVTFSQGGMDEEALKTAIRDNADIIHLAPENPYVALLPREQLSTAASEDLDLFDDSQVTGEDLTLYALAMAQSAAQQPQITVAESQVVGVTSHSAAVASNGFKRYRPMTRYSAQAKAFAQSADGAEMESGYDYTCTRHFADRVAPELIGREAVDMAVSSLGAIMPRAGKMPIVLNHDAAEQFFQNVYAAIDGTAVYRGKTFMKDKVGQKVMSESVTLVDDPRVKRGLSSMDIDSAGLLAKPIAFIESGILKSFNINLMEARQLGLDPIGREDGPANTIILPGTQSPDELIADIEYGIYITAFHGGEVDVNDGKHSRQAQGFVIQDGKITEQAVNGFGVAGNLQDMFMNVVLANESLSLPSPRYDTVAPITRINDVVIAV
ncbi:MAG: hypothetical protein CL570_08540 [Alphaproteobacteria bacterium]|nr:hypothetical protein [Alphaproteobacteria bacterium]HCQ71628.1 hypothetical protein [Rhodospirillaceae bacterium]|tara:strand:+ start:19637 stop:20989 length:1353 start_codon:yes stop_codon:yes gene_type:complete